MRGAIRSEHPVAAAETSEHRADAAQLRGVGRHLAVEVRGHPQRGSHREQQREAAAHAEPDDRDALHVVGDHEVVGRRLERAELECIAQVGDEAEPGRGVEFGPRPGRNAAVNASGSRTGGNEASCSATA